MFHFHFQGVINLLKSEIEFFGCTKGYECSWFAYMHYSELSPFQVEYHWYIDLLCTDISNSNYTECNTANVCIGCIPNSNSTDKPYL